MTDTVHPQQLVPKQADTVETHYIEANDFTLSDSVLPGPPGEAHRCGSTDVGHTGML